MSRDGRWPYPRIVAHRGGGTLAPENTLGAIRHGAALGFRGFEIDVMLAGDGTPVLIHDENLERTTGLRANVAETPYARIASLDAGVWHGERWRGERVPTYAQAAALFIELGLWVNVEIKPAQGHEAATGREVARMTRALWRTAPAGTPVPLLSSFSAEALAAARESAPELRRGMIVRAIPADWHAHMQVLDAFSLHCSRKVFDPVRAAAVRSAGYGLACWTVNEPGEARALLAAGADCLITDRLDLIVPGFAEAA